MRWNMSCDLREALSSECFYVGADAEFVWKEAFESDRFLIVFVEKGKAKFMVGHNEYSAESGCVLTFRPHMSARLLRSSASFKAVVLGFPIAMLHDRTQRMTPNFFMMLYTRVVWKNVGRQYREQMDHFKGLFRFAVLESASFNRELVQAMVTGFVFAFYEMCGVAQESLPYADSSRSRELFSRFIHLMNESYRTQHEVQYYAGKLCISAKYLTQITKRMIARTPKQIIDERLIHEATTLLNKYDSSIQEISNKLGFVDQSYFGRFFKRMMNMSPQQYRVSPKG